MATGYVPTREVLRLPGAFRTVPKYRVALNVGVGAALPDEPRTTGDLRPRELGAELLEPEHPEYLAVRAHLPAPWQDILDLAYYSGWRKQEILGLTWDEIDEAGGVIRLSPARSKTLVGRILPISQPIAEALARRRARRDPDSPLVFHRLYQNSCK